MAELPAWTQPIDPRFVLAYGLHVAGPPHGKGSVRVVQIDRIVAPGIRQRRARGIQAPKSRTYEERVALLARHQPPRGDFSLPLDGPLVLRVLAIRKRPKNLSRMGRMLWNESEPEGRTFAPVTPDWDNIGKTCDGLTKGGVITDDARIVDGRVVKLYGRKGETPFVEIAIFAPQGKS